MATQKLYDESDVRSIATALRNVTGLPDTYNISEMATAVTQVYDSPNALETAVRTYDLAAQISRPSKPIEESDYSPEVIEDIQNLLSKIGGE